MVFGGDLSPRRVAGVRNDPLRGFRFKVTISGFSLPLGFSKVTGLSMGDSDVIEYREGDEIISPRKIPGLNKYDNLTLERGVNFDGTMVQWRRMVAYAGGGGYLIPDGFPPGSEFRRNMFIELMDRNGVPAKIWKVFYSWPKSLKYSDMDAMTSDIFIETCEIATEGIEILDLGALAAGVATLTGSVTSLVSGII